MDTEIPKAYDPKAWEDDLYRKWEGSGFFNPDTCIEKGITDATKPTYSIVLPPPNVTGTLHAGHAAMLAIEDTVVRYHRMKGDRTLWLPGTDHAAIATQSKVEKILMKEEGKNRHDLGRDEFLKRVEAFAADSHDTIVNQCKKMGSSLDWSREAYTLDEKRSLAVRTAFKKMYDDGLIYRGYRPVNWSVKGQSTCSDDELVSVDRKATLSTFKYSKDFPIAIATTRPETKLGDTAVAVHPDDERYKEFVGKIFEIDSFALGPKLSIKIIADEMVDPAFGTGAVGITPAHSHTDYDFYLRHKESDEVAFAPHGEPVIGTDGKMTAAAGGAYAGLSVLEAREKVVASLRSSELLESEVEIDQSVGTSDRYEDVVEVIPMKQWFIDVNKKFIRDSERDPREVSLKQLMRESVSSGRVTILPDRFAKTYFHWIDNLRDWCISRQIWFGHRIPVWYRTQGAGNGERGTEEVYCGINAPEGEGWKQDPDTLDTWFSSGLWTFSTLGWPNTEAEDFKNYHPTNLLETGYDILFFWVARMILMTEYLIGTHPFDTVYLHGLVRDGEGRKMSKSLGNTIDPLTVSEEHGADALRVALMSGATPGNDTKLASDKIVAMRNLTNKLWNIARYVGTMSAKTDGQAVPKSDADHNLIAKLERVTASITRHLDGYELSLATEELRAFTWDDFADWYVEVHKIEKNDALLRHAFDTILKLWHPFMPFVTEAIHQTLRLDKSEFLVIAKWPSQSPSGIVAGRPTSEPTREMIADENRFELVKNLIVKIRNIRSVYHIDPAVKMVVSTRDASEQTIRDNEAVFKRLARVSEVRTADIEIPEHTLLIQSGLLQAFLHLDGAIDIEKERARIGKELAETEKYVVSLEAKLSNTAFTDRAPQALVKQTRATLDTARAKTEELQAHLSSLG
ncbi:MAG: valine--tRNA ligase [Candidatus Moranbacteria bacterium]|nr:valine--tRNA ligase [Candidatus Moranbacteria bacterium]